MSIISKIKEWNHRRLERRNPRRAKAPSFYVFETNPEAPYVFVSYIPYAFFYPPEAFCHQNMREQIVMVRVLNEMGYNVYVSNYMDGPVPAELDCKVVFGIPPLIEKAMKQYPGALKIFYGCTAYWEHQERMTKERTDLFNREHQAQVAYQRLPEHTASEHLADHILQIGSRYTVETYPEELRSKITLIHQSTTVEELSLPVPNSCRTDYIWFGSSGGVLKGVDLVLDYFIAHPSLVLHVVGGPLEKDLLSAYSGRLTPNIHIYGWLDVKSPRFGEIVGRCAFLVYPSCSEGGCPGAVLTMMKLGVIPIVSRYAAFDGIEDYGHVVDDLSVEAVGKGVEWSQTLTMAERDARSEAGSRHVAATFNLGVYEKELKRYFSSILPDVKHNIKAEEE